MGPSSFSATPWADPLDVSDRAGAALAGPPPGRGLAAGDFDNDGRVDLLLVGENAPLALLHNQSQSASRNHFLMLVLEGTASNRDAVGAQVTVTLAGRTQVARGSAAEATSRPATPAFISG